MISIVLPVIRQDKAHRCIEAIKDNAGGVPHEIRMAVDTGGRGCPEMVKLLTEQASGEMVMFLGDDTIPQPGFLAAALDAMNALPDGWGVVGLNTQDDRPGAGFNDHAHWMAHKKMLDYIPGGAYFSTDYRHCYGDDELKDIAVELGRWTVAEDCRILHDHPVNQTADEDEGYQKAYATLREDWTTYHRRKVDRKGFNIAIGLPLTGTQEHRLFSSSYRHAVYTYLRMDGAPSLREYEPDVPIGQFARDIAHNRNDIVRQALADGVSHVIMLDTDQIYPQDIIVKLARHAAQGRDVVIGPVHRRYDPFELILMRGEPDSYLYIGDEEKYSGEMIEVDAGGTGCIMFSMRAVLEIPEPWFRLGKTPKGKDIGEDIGFCWNLRRAGYRIWADTSIEIAHMAEIVINRQFHEIWKRLNKQELKTI